MPEDPPIETSPVDYFMDNWEAITWTWEEYNITMANKYCAPR